MAQLTADNIHLPLKALAGGCFVPKPHRDVGNAGLSGGFSTGSLSWTKRQTRGEAWALLTCGLPLEGWSRTVRKIRNVLQVYPDDLEVTRG